MPKKVSIGRSRGRRLERGAYRIHKSVWKAGLRKHRRTRGRVSPRLDRFFLSVGEQHDRCAASIVSAPQLGEQLPARLPPGGEVDDDGLRNVRRKFIPHARSISDHNRLEPAQREPDSVHLG